jgi:hypothetical protein
MHRQERTIGILAKFGIVNVLGINGGARSVLIGRERPGQPQPGDGVPDALDGLHVGSRRGHLHIERRRTGREGFEIRQGRQDRRTLKLRRIQQGFQFGSGILAKIVRARTGIFKGLDAN